MKIKFKTFKVCFFMCLLCFVSANVFAQHKSVTNIVGNGSSIYLGDADGSPIDALSTGLKVPGAIAFAPNGDFYFTQTDISESRIYKYNITTKEISIYKETPAGILTSIACDADGNLYYNLFDATGGVENFYIHKLSPDGTDAYYIGNGTYTWTGGDGPAATMTVANPRGLFIDQDSKYMYYTEDAFGVIRRVNLVSDYVELYVGDYTGVVSNIVIPDGTPRLEVDAELATGKAVGADGSLYFWTKLNQVYKVNADDGIVNLVAGNGETGGDGDGGLAVNAQLASNGLGALLIYGADQLLIADFDNNKIRSVNLNTGIISVFAGTGSFFGDGNAEEDLQSGEYLGVENTNLRALDMKLDSDGNILFSDTKAFYICKIVDCQNPELVDILIEDETNICVGDEIKLTISGDLNDAVNWEWFIGACAVGDPSSKGTALVDTISANTSYFVRATGGCTNNAMCIQKDVELTCQQYYNSFTPNGDGFNDYFEIPVLNNFPVNKVLFYDRWGHLLEEVKNYDNVESVWYGTNGSDGGVPDVLDSGTYFFIAFDEAGGEIVSGWIQLITK